MGNTPVSPQTTAAVQVYTKVGLAPRGFLGWGETSPRYRYEYGFIPWFTDLGGPVIPFDRVFAGQQAFLSVNLNFFRQDQLTLVETAPNPFGINGRNALGDVGSLMGFEGLTTEVTLVFPNYAKPAYRATGMPPGVRFYTCVCIGPSTYQPGNSPTMINLIWVAQPGFNRRTLGTLLRANDVSGLPPQQ